MHHAIRRLLASPGFTLTALATLALGIGVNSTAFSVLNALLLHQPPYPEPERLVRVYRTSPHATRWPHSAAAFLDLRSRNTVFEHLAALRWTSLNLAEPGQPADRLRALLVTANFFPLLGVSAELGRTFTPEDDRPGGDAVVVISHATWLQRFGADPGVLGRRVRINGEPVTIVGVMPARFDDYQLWGEVAAWRPLALTPSAAEDRVNHYLSLIGRLKPGVSFRAAESELRTLAGQLAVEHPRHNAHTSLRLMELGPSGQDDLGRRVTLLIMGLAGFVLLIACANLANLQFARNAAREREHAIRAALGASRTQIIRHVLAESLVLALAGGALGLVLALWSNDLVGRHFVWGDRVGLEIPLNWRVVGFTFAVSVCTGIAFGLLPACLASRASVSDALKQGGRGATGGRPQHRVRHALIVAEIALALVLLAGAGFFIRSLQAFTKRDPGWRVDGLLGAYVSLHGERYRSPAARTAFYERLHERLAALPGVERATIGSTVPTWGLPSATAVVVEGQPEPAPGRSPMAGYADVLPGYFETLGIRLLQGRDFTPADREGRQEVAIINETMARRLWPGENPLGKRIGSAVPFMANPRVIVGVVSDVHAAAVFGTPETPLQLYRPLAQTHSDHVTIALRADGAPDMLAQELRRAVAAIDPDQAVYRIAPITHEVRRSLASVGVAAWTLAGFAVLGLLLAAIGIYGVISNAVVQRTNEIGIRMALGAQVRDVFRLILRGGLRLTLLGVAVGLVGAAGMARLLRAISPEFSRADPGLTAAVTAVLIVVALVACWLPARRAAKLDPMTALRAE